MSCSLIWAEFLRTINQTQYRLVEPPTIFTCFVPFQRQWLRLSLVEEIKKSSSKWIKTKGAHYSNFYWQDGYGGFSVSNSGVDAVKRYILNQKKHHEKVSFTDEYKNLLEVYGIPYEERYLWCFDYAHYGAWYYYGSSYVGLGPTLPYIRPTAFIHHISFLKA